MSGAERCSSGNRGRAAALMSGGALAMTPCLLAAAGGSYAALMAARVEARAGSETGPRTSETRAVTSSKPTRLASETGPRTSATRAILSKLAPARLLLRPSQPNPSDLKSQRNQSELPAGIAPPRPMAENEERYEGNDDPAAEAYEAENPALPPEGGSPPVAKPTGFSDGGCSQKETQPHDGREHRDRSERREHRDCSDDRDRHRHHSHDSVRRRDRDRDSHRRHRSCSLSKGRDHISRSRSRSCSKSKRVSGFDQGSQQQASPVVAPGAAPGQLPVVPPAIPGMLPNMFNLAQTQFNPFVIQPQGMTQQGTQHARRVYVGGLPPTANEHTVALFFNQVMAAIGGNTAGPGDAVLDVYINHNKNFAFVDMRSVEEASNAMALNGIMLEGAPVKVRRPSDYNPFLAAALGPSQPNPNLNLAAVGLIPGSAGGLGDPDLIFVGAIPRYYTEAQVRELLESFGPLRCFNLVKDRETGNSRGYAFCVYEDLKVTDTACAALNGVKVGDRTLIVKRANRGSSQHRPEQESILLQAQQLVETRRLMYQVPTKVVCLIQVVSADELRDDEGYEDIVQDMREEGSKYVPHYAKLATYRRHDIAI
ncbi:hypothetical protein GUJ93_ZPchr0011g27039 [Zizania palustris]|uniref:Splicing factor U2af large subunit n=1 Tax=Zizania palustris TaxID=103762 RepID=A0A8J6BTA5_ZIZPA|nr:hypothetical protein GUJ93_ZPchr0011g27039 [Zizania palustris]